MEREALIYIHKLKGGVYEEIEAISPRCGIGMNVVSLVEQMIMSPSSPLS
jgi:hypothetical protein